MWVAAGMVFTSQQVGRALGLAVLVSVANAGGIELALWWRAAIALVGAVVALRLKHDGLRPSAIVETT